MRRIKKAAYISHLMKTTLYYFTVFPLLPKIPLPRHYNFD